MPQSRITWLQCLETRVDEMKRMETSIQVKQKRITIAVAIEVAQRAKTTMATPVEGDLPKTKAYRRINLVLARGQTLSLRRSRVWKSRIKQSKIFSSVSYNTKRILV